MVLFALDRRLVVYLYEVEVDLGPGDPDGRQSVGRRRARVIPRLAGVAVLAAVAIGGAPGPDGDIWFTEWTGNRIGRIPMSP